MRGLVWIFQCGIYGNFIRHFRCGGGILYASVYVTVYNILLWTVGYSFVTKKKCKRRLPRVYLRHRIIAVFIGLILYMD